MWNVAILHLYIVTLYMYTNVTVVSAATAEAILCQNSNEIITLHSENSTHKQPHDMES